MFSPIMLSMASSARAAGRGIVRMEAPCAPEDLFALFADEPYSFFLDSALECPRLGRYAFLGSRPFLVVTARGRSCTVSDGRGVRRERADPFEVLRRLVSLYRQDGIAGAPPFVNGAVGFVSYDAGRLLERLRQPSLSPVVPDLCFAFYESVVACDLKRKEISIVPTGLTGPTGSMSPEQAGRARVLLERVRSARAPLGARPPRARFRLLSPLVSNFDRERYLQAVESVRDFIARGEIYQANFTQRFSSRWTGDPFDLYGRLRAASPAPFAAYLNFGAVRVLSSSPERFLRVAGSRIETRPIKGTRPRGSDAAGDRSSALELVRSPKDMAEHMMIVDLERNDLGRVCETGSVRVSEQAALEVYPQVFHLTSTVEGRLQRGLTAVDALRAAFPGGSITGAPKIRAEEILAQLESTPRGLYTGALGYVGFSGDCDLAIVIRTLVLAGRSLSFGVGGGVVADSDPEMEYEESLHKARGMLDALGCDPGSGLRAAAAGRGERSGRAAG